jgi:hypothetical protein
MKDIKLTDDGDLDFSSNDYQFIQDDDVIVQTLETRFQFFKGEWFLDTRLGVPYFQRVLVKGTPLHVIESIFREVIRTTPGIRDVIKLTVEVEENRIAKISFQAVKVDGEILDFNRPLVVDLPGLEI